MDAVLLRDGLTGQVEPKKKPIQVFKNNMCDNPSIHVIIVVYYICDVWIRLCMRIVMKALSFFLVIQTSPSVGLCLRNKRL